MREDKLILSGINRLAGEQAIGNGACEELINLRFEGNSLKPCGTKGTLLTGTPYFEVFEHPVSGNGTPNYIGIKRTSTNTVVVQFSMTTGQAIGSAIATLPASDDVQLQYIGNILIVGSKLNRIIYCYTYQQDGYKLLYSGHLPEINIQISTSFVERASETGSSEEQGDGFLDGVRDKYQQSTIKNSDLYAKDVDSVINYIRHFKNHDETEGFVGICANYTLYDGSETKPTQPIWVYLGGLPTIKYTDSSNGRLVVFMPRGTAAARMYTISGNDFDSYKDLIKKVNFYCTYPKSLVDIDASYKNSAKLESLIYSWIEKNNRDVDWIRVNPTGIETDDSGSFDFSYKLANDINLGGELFYRQSSVAFESSSTTKWTQFKFNEDMLTGKTMEVENSGYVERYGKMKVYNGRVHLFDSINRLQLPGDGGTNDEFFKKSWTPATTDDGYLTNYYNMKIVVYTRTETSEIKTLRRIKLPWTTANNRKYLLLRNLCTVIDSRSYKVDIYTDEIAGTYYKVTLSLRESTAYNYAFVRISEEADGCYYQNIHPMNYNPQTSSKRSLAYDIGAIDLSNHTASSTDNYSTIDPSDFEGLDTYRDTDVVSVSALNNPTFYPAENSYRVGGNIKAISPMSVGISDVQIGQYPLAVFTDNGIYAMQHGEWKVLYSSVVKINDTIASGDICPTVEGLVFPSGDGIYLLSGRTAIRLSAPLDGYPDMDIRECVQFQNAHYSSNTLLYNIAGFLSACDIREDILAGNAVLSFDHTRNELIVSIKNRDYSYVYGFNGKSWHKITERFDQGSTSLSVTKVVNSNSSIDYSIRDLNTETLSETGLVHIQSRPFKCGSEGYKSLYRTQLLSNINNLRGTHEDVNNVFSLYLYGSRDIRNWSMIGQCQRTGYQNLMQIAKTSGAYKYFLISAGGRLSQHSELNYLSMQVSDKFNNKIR